MRDCDNCIHRKADGCEVWECEFETEENRMVIDKYYHLYGRKDDVVFEEIPKPERKKGKWIGKPLAGCCTVRCSVCNDAFLENSGKWNFCPNCGADMRG